MDDNVDSTARCSGCQQMAAVLHPDHGADPVFDLHDTPEGLRCRGSWREVRAYSMKEASDV